MASTGKKTKQNVFADDDDGQQPNAAFNQAVEAARHATTPLADQDSMKTSTSGLAPMIQPTSKPEKQKPDRDSDDYTKVTYRVRNEAADAVEDMKLLLKRKYGFKRVLLEEIVEAAILGIKRDLDEQKGQSILVQWLREQNLPENQ